MVDKIPSVIISAVIAFVTAYVTSYFQYRDYKRKREYDSKVELNSTVKKYSAIVLLTAIDLQDRLWHLCNQSESKKPILLENDPKKPIYNSWPMTKEHYLTSTVYFFARYFCWVEILKSKVRYLDFGDDDKTNEFSYHIKRIERALAETDFQRYQLFPEEIPEKKIFQDYPLFQLLQAEIGQSILKNDNDPECRNYHEFLGIFENPRAATQNPPPVAT